MTLETFFDKHNKAALAFSGGADSSFLLWKGKQCGAELGVYIVKSAFQPDFELDDAKRLCDELSMELHILRLDVLSVPGVKENTPERCYFCKRAVFSAIRNAAKADGFSVLLDGTNASDDASDRPGMRATAELEVLSPLRMCGITKKELRALSREAGLFTADKPAYACLATRVQTNLPLTEALLHRVEKAETDIARLGFSDFRVRTDGSAARLELLASQLPAAEEKWGAICEVLGAFSTVTLASRQPRD